MKHARLLLTTGMLLAAITFNAINMPRAAAQTKGHCSDYITYRNSTFDAERRVKSEISGIQREIADAKSPNSGNLDRKVANALSLVQTIRRTIADLEGRASPNTELWAILEFHKRMLPKAQAQLDFWQAKQTQALTGDTVAISVPSSFVNDLETRLAALQREHAQLVPSLAEAERQLASCQARYPNRTSSPDPCAEDKTSLEPPSSPEFRPFMGFREQVASQRVKPMYPNCRKPQPSSAYNLSGQWIFTWTWSVTSVSFIGTVSGGPHAFTFQGKVLGGGNAVWTAKEGSATCSLSAAKPTAASMTCTATFPGSTWSGQTNGTFSAMTISGHGKKFYYRGPGKGTTSSSTATPGPPAGIDAFELKPKD
jgi:hypothetical protein